MSALIPAWILGAPFIGLLILAFSFKGPSAMGGGLPRPPRVGQLQQPAYRDDLSPIR